RAEDRTLERGVRAPGATGRTALSDRPEPADRALRDRDVFRWSRRSGSRADRIAAGGQAQMEERLVHVVVPGPDLEDAASLVAGGHFAPELARNAHHLLHLLD